MRPKEKGGKSKGKMGGYIVGDSMVVSHDSPINN